jgi:signal transduction histidine kinase
MGGMPPVLPRLEASVTQKFTDMDRVIALKQERRDAESLGIIRTNRGKLLMDEINLFVSGIVRAADDKLTTGVIEQRGNAARLRLASILAALLIALVVAGIVITIYRYTREVRSARDEVKALNTSLEARVAARTAELARANAEVQQFAHIVSHDLRAPLVNIVGFTGELEAGLASLQEFVRSAPANSAAGITPAAVRTLAEADMPEALAFIRSSTHKMDGLISAILKISREGQRRLQPQQVNLADIIQAAQDAVRHQLIEAGGHCSLEAEANMVVTDRLSLEQIFGNLFDNAVKYRAPDRPLQIAIRTRHDGRDRVRIEVEDNGRGIAKNDLERVFELFRRAGTNDRPGEGVGLAYVRSIVRNLGGEIGVASELGRGTTFSIVLPTDLRRVQTENAA